jgi:hypothetical protein
MPKTPRFLDPPQAIVKVLTDWMRELEQNPQEIGNEESVLEFRVQRLDHFDGEFLTVKIKKTSPVALILSEPEKEEP